MYVCTCMYGQYVCTCMYGQYVCMHASNCMYVRHSCKAFLFTLDCFIESTFEAQLNAC